MDNNENWKKKYEDAVKAMKQWDEPCHTKEQLKALKESVFPELAVSPDEKNFHELMGVLGKAGASADYQKHVAWWLRGLIEKANEASDGTKEEIPANERLTERIYGFRKGYDAAWADVENATGVKTTWDNSDRDTYNLIFSIVSDNCREPLRKRALTWLEGIWESIFRLRNFYRNIDAEKGMAELDRTVNAEQ